MSYIIEPPENWKEVWDRITDMRKERNAPVDSMGCESLPERPTPQVLNLYHCISLTNITSIFVSLLLFYFCCLFCFCFALICLHYCCVYRYFDTNAWYHWCSARKRKTRYFSLSRNIYIIFPFFIQMHCNFSVKLTCLAWSVHSTSDAGPAEARPHHCEHSHHFHFWARQAN